ncbi:hypothetical protein [Cyclobacterium qasimii]|nr:hypothetical protein [Cyclobacterium qasimii]
MGDTGSLSVGFSLTVLVILFVDKTGLMAPWEGLKLNAPFSAGLAFLIVPVYDTVRIFIKRTMNGRSPLKPDKSHVHHFLIRMGLHHDQVSLVLVVVKLSFISIVFFGYSLSDHILLPTIAIIATVLGIWMDRKTLEKVKINCKNSPSVSGKNADRVKRRQNKRKPSIAKNMFSNNKINMN